MPPTPEAPWPLSTLLLALLGGWGVISSLAADRLARRRGLTRLAAALDPRSWAAERLLGLPLRALLGLWAAAVLAAWAVAGRG
ncbi:MAG: hypothetical protein NDI82_00565 [Anaeromyxobacteraceae bacterium]|nr:hypothetical protein [Anaeromyxobacteraceae bacterium]